MILQRMQSMEAKQSLQLGDKACLVSCLVSYRTLGAGVFYSETSNRQVSRRRLANHSASGLDYCHPCARQKNKAGPHCKFAGAAALEQSVKVASSNIGADASAALRRGAAPNLVQSNTRPSFGISKATTQGGVGRGG